MPSPPKPSPFAQKLAEIAKAEYDEYHGHKETSAKMSQRIQEYYAFLGFDFESVGVAWSAVFVSFCVKKAGATSAEFKFALAHSRFVHNAIHNGGAFQGLRISERAVNVGDIIQGNRSNNVFRFQFAKDNKAYESHSAIVISRGEDAHGKFAVTVGGNESNSVGRATVRLLSSGAVKQKTPEPYICVLKNLK